MKLKKVIWVIQRKLIGLINYISASKYMSLYNNYLRNICIKISQGGRCILIRQHILMGLIIA